MEIRQVYGYRLLRQIGRGGMSTVYEALDPAGRRVAFKRLHPAIAAAPETRQRLRREIAMLQRISGLGIAQIIDAEIEADEVFIVTELIEGLTLEKDVEVNGIYTEEDLLTLGRQLQNILESVHQAGVLHRDIKPANVMIGKQGPVLIDFGLSQLGEDTRLTQQGFLAHTPGYCDPQILEGAAPNKEADWWALTAVLAYAATGVDPYGKGNAPAVMQKVLYSLPDLPDLSPVLQLAFQRALAVDLQQRITYTELLEVISDPESMEIDLAEVPTILSTSASTLIAETPASAVTPTLVAGSDFVPDMDLAADIDALPELDSAFESEIEYGARDSAVIDAVVMSPKDVLPLLPRCRLQVFLFWIAASLALAAAPVPLVFIFATIVLLLDLIGSSYRANMRRQMRRGHRSSSDTSLTLIRLPLTLLGTFFRGILMAAISSGVCYGSFQILQIYYPDYKAGIIYCLALGIATAWLLPTGSAARLGIRRLYKEISPNFLRRLLWWIIGIGLAGGAYILWQLSFGFNWQQFLNSLF